MEDQKEMLQEQLNSLGVSKVNSIAMPESVFKEYLKAMTTGTENTEVISSWYDTTRNQKVVVVDRNNQPLFEVPGTGETDFLDLEADYESLIHEAAQKDNWFQGAGSSFLHQNLEAIANQMGDTTDRANENQKKWNDILVRYGYADKPTSENEEIPKEKLDKSTEDDSLDFDYDD